MLLKRGGSRRIVPLYPVLGLLGAYSQALLIVPSCQSSVYCTGDLLHRVQLARVFPDSKTFVDLKQVYSENKTLTDFAKLLDDTNRNPSREQLIKFVSTYFEECNELQEWSPPDFTPEPPVLDKIRDLKLKEFAKNVVGIWAHLGRKVDPLVADYPEKYSFLFVPRGFIIPGGRFRELYYWDSYWIVRGLLVSGMKDTAKGMIENLLFLVKKIGYVPNGSRIYYQGRSQPPLLAAMVNAYYEATGDINWLEQHITTIERELQYWLDEKTVKVNVKGKNYLLVRYIANKLNNGPRPESYYEDYTNAKALKDELSRERFYNEIRSAAESGWDFTSRWFVTAANNKIGNLTDVHITRILPVDLNSIFAGALHLAGDFRQRLKDRRGAHKWWSLSNYWRRAIDKVMWDPVDGIWYDYDVLACAPRRHFYPSCLAPFWSGVVNSTEHPLYIENVIRYLNSSGALKFPGGIPSSLVHSGEQWDFPNAWPPLQSIMILGLEATGNAEARRMAKELAEIWVRANYFGYKTWQLMFEKYSVMEPGHNGGGGEYGVQEGFGWTNGVVLELLQKYGGELQLHDSNLTQFNISGLEFPNQKISNIRELNTD